MGDLIWAIFALRPELFWLAVLSLQRRGAREQLDQSQTENGVLISQENCDEDIVVDALDAEPRDAKDKEFVLPGGQIIGLDQAVLQSIERCRMYHSMMLIYISGTRHLLIIYLIVRSKRRAQT